MSALFRATIVVQHVDPRLTPMDFIARNLALHLDAEPGAPVLRGVVRSFRQLTLEESGVSRYEIILVPALAFLAFRTDAWIFNDENAPAMLQECLDVYEGVVPPKSVLGEETLPVHEYRVQYLETDLDFVWRVLAEDGIAARFDVFSACELVLLTDTRTQPSEPALVLPFASASSMSPSIDHVYAIEIQGGQTSLMHAVEDQWVEQPDYYPFAKAPDNESHLMRYLFEPGLATTDEELAVHAEELFWAEYSPANTITVRSTAYVPAGYHLRIENSPRKQTEGDLLVIEVTSKWSGGHDGTPRKREHVLVCLPLQVRFVPKRPPKRRIPGLQKAAITGEGEIDVDSLGRVLCAFHWAEDCVTRRVLVSQAWAGPGYGHFVHPRVGDEVLIAYLDGDPNEPIVVGRLNNAVAPPPLPLPENKTVSFWRTKSSPGGEGYNEILFDDLAGSERFNMHAQLDYQCIVERDSTGYVGRDLWMEVKGDTHTNIVGSTVHSAGVSSSFEVPKFTVIAGSELRLDGPTTRMHSAFRTDDIDSVYNVNANEEYHHAAGVWQMTGPKFHVFSDNIVLQAGGSMIKITPGGISIQSAGAVVVNGEVIKLNC